MGFGTYVEATLKFVIYGLLPSFFFSLFIRFNSKFCLVYFSFLFCRSNIPNGKLHFQNTIVITFSLFPLRLLLTFPVYISTYCK